jgi:hypothetical protein
MSDSPDADFGILYLIGLIAMFFGGFAAFENSVLVGVAYLFGCWLLMLCKCMPYRWSDL